MAIRNHRRIRSIYPVTKPVRGRERNQRIGWHVWMYGKFTKRIEQDVVTVRTTKADGTPLARPVKTHSTQFVDVPSVGIHVRYIKRRSTLRKLGVRSIPR